jgi:hypothetical protein|nr:hypothetical protein [Chryseobacterium lathyri]
MELHLQITGMLLIVLAFVHIIFPKHFNWEKELQSLSLMNRQMMWVHTLFITLTIFLMGLLCITSPHELTDTGLGKKITFGLAVFWTVRLFIQFFGYSSELWKGKTFETVIHIIFSLFWTYISVLFWIICFKK